MRITCTFIHRDDDEFAQARRDESGYSSVRRVKITLSSIIIFVLQVSTVRMYHVVNLPLGGLLVGSFGETGQRKTVRIHKKACSTGLSDR